MWFPTRVHSHYSLLQSTLKPKNIVKIAKELGYDAVSLTDFCSISGAVKFSQECEANGIKGVLGCEIVVSSGTITLLCKNKDAWVQLLEIVSICNDAENYKKTPTISLDRLSEVISDKNDFICIDGYAGSSLFYEMVEKPKEIYKSSDYNEAGKFLNRDWKSNAVNHISKYRKIFGKDYYLEINRLDAEFPASDLISNCLVELQDSIDFNNIIAGCPVYYGKQKDAIDHQLILCTKMKTTLSKADAVLEKEDNYELTRFFKSNSYHLTEKEKIKESYRKVYVDNVKKINKACEEYTILSAPRLPQFDCPKGLSQIEYVKDLCRQGWRSILADSGKVDKPEDIEKYKNRVLEELEVIEEADLAGYFLIVHDYVNEFRSRGCLVGPGRGSAAGCLVSYLIGITLIDPIEYNLLFSRFYNRARVGSLPDIDIDFPPDVRDDVITYLNDKYGDSKVCQMLTFGRLQGKSALKEVLRVNDSCSFDQMNEITKTLPQEASISDKLEDMDEPSVIRWALENDPDSLREFCWMDDDSLKGDYAKEFEQAMRIEGTFKTQGKHAAGVVVSSVDLDGVCPMVKATRSNEKIAGMEMNDLEAVGAVKFDILGVNLLKKIHETCGAV